MAYEYLIALPVEPMPARTQYPAGVPLPLHCTVMPWFSLSERTMHSVMFCEFEDIAKQLAPGAIELVSEREDQFGPNNDVPVHVLARNPALLELHETLHRWLAQTGSQPKDSPWIRDGYRPHIATIEGRSFPPGSRHVPSGLVLVSRPPTLIKYVISAPPSAKQAA